MTPLGHVGRPGFRTSGAGCSIPVASSARSPLARIVLEPRLASALMAALVGVSFVAAAFARGHLCDEAFLVFRTVENVRTGHGLRWNTCERVQAYASPLWMGLLVGVDYFVGDPALTATFLSTVLIAATFVACVVATPPHERWRAFLGCALLASTSTFLGAAISGLELPLTSFLLVLFLARYAMALEGGPAIAARAQTLSISFASALLATRLGSSLLVLPAVLHLLVLARRDHGWRRATVSAALLVAPAVLWLSLSLFYYGSLLPNTTLAMLTSAPASVRFRTAVARALALLASDPAAIAVAALALGGLLVGARRAERIVASGMVLYLLQALVVGGGAGLGRRLAEPIVVCAWIVARRVGRRSAWGVAALMAGCLVMQSRPPESSADIAESAPAIAFGAFRANGKPAEIRRARLAPRDSREYRADRDLELGSLFRLTADPIAIRMNAGRFGFAAGPSKIVIDSTGATDPLLARVSASGVAAQRPIPAGYVDTLATGENRIVDPDLARYYERLRIVTREPLFAPARLHTLVRLLLGRYDRWRDAHLARAGGPGAS